MFQSKADPTEGDEPTGAPSEPEATGRRRSTERPPPADNDAVTTGATETFYPDSGGLLTADDNTVDAAETPDDKTDLEKETAKYIEKRG